MLCHQTFGLCQPKFERLEKEMKEINVNSEALKSNYLELTELKRILRKTQNLFARLSRILIQDERMTRSFYYDCIKSNLSKGNGFKDFPWGPIEQLVKGAGTKPAGD